MGKLKPAIVVEWDRPEAANPNYFYDLNPGESKQAKLIIKSKFPNIPVPRLRVATPLPTWLRVSPSLFIPPAELIVEVDILKIDIIGKDIDWSSQFDLEFIINE